MAQGKRRATKAASIWWATHFILVMERIKPKKTGPRYFVWENVYLVRARSSAEARRNGDRLGRSEVIPDATLRWNGSPARLAYGGVRKVISCAEGLDRPTDGLGGDVATIRDGDEATYSTFLIPDLASLRRLIRGDPVSLVYEK